MEKKYSILTFYGYFEIRDPISEVERQKNFLKDLDARSRVYVAYNGINAQMSLLNAHALQYVQWLQQDQRFQNILFQIQLYTDHVFPKLTIKFRKQLVALDQMPDLNKRGEHLSPKKWKEMLEQRDHSTFLIDVRNEYESEIGYFEGAHRPPLKNFREFSDYAKQLANEKDKKNTKVMMYCTGGIRCETYSALLRELGFEKVYQLQGGVIHYGQEIGKEHWKGKLFVFDDRLSTPLNEEEHEILSECSFCSCKTDTYYNCANMDCNELFLCCVDCADQQYGCCSHKCTTAPRRRPYLSQERPKPFRKAYLYQEVRHSTEEEKCQ